jgi:hypothetical protein
MRDEKAYNFYENSAKLSYYYHSMNLIEWSNILIFDYYKRHNYEFLLHPRPDIVLSRWVTDSKVDNQYGIDPNTKGEWLKILKEQLKTPGEIDRMLDLDLMKAFINFKKDPKYNCDLTIAAALCMVQINENDYVDSENIEEEFVETRPNFGYRKSSSGIITFTQN